MLEVMEAANFKTLYGARHGFFTRKGGVSEGIFASLNNGLSGGDELERVIENRRRVAERLEAGQERLLVCHQIHSPDVVTVTGLWERTNNPKADAMVTSMRGVALGILTADCVPLLFADIRAGVIGAAHAGWRGAISGVIENTLDAMIKLGANRKTIHAALGPCIWQNSYEVGPEFPAPFLAENPDHARFFRPAFRSDHYMFNLPGYVEAKLRALGLGSVEPSPADTAADEERFFSYRRSTLRGGQKTGSLISAVVLAD